MSNFSKKCPCNCPHPIWYMATYMKGKDNYAKAAEVIEMQTGDISDGSIKKRYVIDLLSTKPPVL